MLFLDGVYEVNSEVGTGKFHEIETPLSGEMLRLLHRISEWIARLLEREGFAPNSAHCAKVTSDAKEKQAQRSAKTKSLPEDEDRRGKMNWAMRLKRVFNIVRGQWESLRASKTDKWLIRFFRILTSKETLYQSRHHQEFEGLRTTQYSSISKFLATRWYKKNKQVIALLFVIARSHIWA